MSILKPILSSLEILIKEAILGRIRPYAGGISWFCYPLKQTPYTISFSFIYSQPSYTNKSFYFLFFCLVPAQISLQRNYVWNNICLRMVLMLSSLYNWKELICIICLIYIFIFSNSTIEKYINTINSIMIGLFYWKR